VIVCLEVEPAAKQDNHVTVNFAFLSNFYMIYMTEYMVHHLLVTIDINKFMSRFMNLSYLSDIQIKIAPWIQLVL
jgi:hypothetical protein